MSKEKMKRTTIYLPESLHESLKNVNKSELVRKNLEQWAKKNGKLLNALVIFIILGMSCFPAMGDNLTMGSNIISNNNFIPFNWWILAFIIGFLLLIGGYIFMQFVLNLISVVFLWLCAYSAPLVGYFSTDTVLTNSSTMTYTTVSTVTMAFQPWVSYMCYGLGALSFMLFTILVFAHIFEAMNSKKKESFNSTEIDEFGGWM